MFQQPQCDCICVCVVSLLPWGSVNLLASFQPSIRRPYSHRCRDTNKYLPFLLCRENTQVKEGTVLVFGHWLQRHTLTQTAQTERRYCSHVLYGNAQWPRRAHGTHTTCKHTHTVTHILRCIWTGMRVALFIALETAGWLVEVVALQHNDVIA